MKKILINIFFAVIIISAQTPNNSISSDEAYLPFADTMPEPVDGLQKIKQQIKYPIAAQQLKYEGKVIALAFINENGDVDKVKIIQGVEGGCNQEVERVLLSSKFKPGIKEGVTVKTKLTMAFVFKLAQ